MTRWLRRPVVWIPITIGLLLLVAWRARLWEAGSRLGAVSPGPFVVAIALNGVVLVLWAIRSGDLLGAAGRPVGVRPLVPMTALANTVNNITPGSVGELLRLYLLKERHGVDYRTGAAVVLIERIVAIGYLAGSAAIAWLAHAAGVPGSVAGLGLLLLALLPAVPYALGLRPSAVVAAVPLGRLIGRDRWNRAAGALGQVDDTIGRLLTNPVRLVVFAGSTALILVIYAAQLWLVGASLGVGLDPLAAWGALGLAITVGVLSFLPFGLGATDLVLATLLGILGVDAPAAAAIVFGYRLSTTVPLALAGSLSYAFLSATLPVGGTGGAMRAAADALDAPGAGPGPGSAEVDA
jgi:uncharacterized membrane protein YbhN (UPF0104 family)